MRLRPRSARGQGSNAIALPSRCVIYLKNKRSVNPLVVLVLVEITLLLVRQRQGDRADGDADSFVHIAVRAGLLGALPSSHFVGNANLLISIAKPAN